MNNEISAKRSQHFMYKLSAEIKAHRLFLWWYLRKIKSMEWKYAEIFLHTLDQIYISAAVFLTVFSCMPLSLDFSGKGSTPSQAFLCL